MDIKNIGHVFKVGLVSLLTFGMIATAGCSGKKEESKPRVYVESFITYRGASYALRDENRDGRIDHLDSHEALTSFVDTLRLDVCDQNYLAIPMSDSTVAFAHEYLIAKSKFLNSMDADRRNHKRNIKARKGK